MNINERESVKVLRECIELQLKKSQDYQNQNSNVVQAMHYRRGVDTIHDIMLGKMIRAQSLLESDSKPNFESLEDTYKDLINYASFAVSYIRGKMEGQNSEHDMFNKPKSENTSELSTQHITNSLLNYAASAEKRLVDLYVSGASTNNTLTISKRW